MKYYKKMIIDNLSTMKEESLKSLTVQDWVDMISMDASVINHKLVQLDRFSVAMWMQIIELQPQVIDYPTIGIILDRLDNEPQPAVDYEKHMAVINRFIEENDIKPSLYDYKDDIFNFIVCTLERGAREAGDIIVCDAFIREAIYQSVNWDCDAINAFMENPKVKEIMLGDKLDLKLNKSEVTEVDIHMWMNIVKQYPRLITSDILTLIESKLDSRKLLDSEYNDYSFLLNNLKKNIFKLQ